MVNILDSFPFPWTEKGAQQLHVTLCQINPSVKSTSLAAQQSGVDISLIDTEQAVYLVWSEILGHAAGQGILRKLVNDVRDRLNANSPYIPFLEDLLNNRSPVLSAEPRSNDGAPIFISGNDEVSNPEALLFNDDLTIQIGKVPALIGSLQNLVTLAPSICHLIVDISGVIQHGTGFRVGKETIMTNWHVLHSIKTGHVAGMVTAEFSFDDNGVGGIVASLPIICDTGTIVSSRENDWAIIKVQSAMDTDWQILELSNNAAPVEGAETYIIQHPNGQRKRLGFVRNQISGFDERVVHYLTDTQAGSSGAPVLDNMGRLVAIHHAGGLPREIAGKSPLQKNEGIRISKILEDLVEMNVVIV